MTNKPVFKLDMFDTLDAANMSNYEYYESLSDEQKKAFAWVPFIRWFSSLKVNDDDLRRYYTIKVNELLNVGVSNGMIFDINTSPDVLWGLASAVGVGIKVPHRWIPKQKDTSKIKSEGLDSLLMVNAPTRNKTELDLYRKLLTEEMVKELGRNHGKTDKEIKELVKEWRSSAGSTSAIKKIK